MEITRTYSLLAVVAACLLAQACDDDGDRPLNPAPGTAGSGGSVAGTDAGGSVNGEPGGEGGASGAQTGEGGAAVNGPKTVLVVLEGLRAEQVSEQLTPNIWRIATQGVRFARHSSVLPSNRMAAAASIATGALPAEHGVLGARMYLPGAQARDAAGRIVDTRQPFSIEDQGTLESLQADAERPLLKAKSFLNVAQSAGFRTLVVGRSGPASLFDLQRAGQVLNDDYVSPRDFAEKVASLELGMPGNAQTLFPDLLAPSAYVPQLAQDLFPADAVIGAYGAPNWRPVPPPFAYSNPILPLAATYKTALELEAAAFVQALADPATDVPALWLREPGETALRLGPGSLATRLVLKAVDKLVAEVEQALPEGSTLFVTSDGGFNTLAGNVELFPRWSVSTHSPPRWVQKNSAGGLPVDGAVRLTDLLNRAGFLAYDGEPCLSGHAYTAYPTFQSAGWPTLCRDTNVDKKGGEQTGPALVPETLDPRAIIVASNGAAELVYLPSHRAGEMDELLAFLATRPEVGAIFAASRYGRLPGVLDLALLGFPKNADIDLLVTYNWDKDDAVASAPQVDVVLGDGVSFGEQCNVKRCRTGLYCDTNCKFCPAGVDPATCELSPSASLEAAQAASLYVPEGGYCEASRFCATGLECVYEQCRKPGERPVTRSSSSPTDPLRGSSYGAMTGVVVRATSSNPGSDRLLRDDHGVRGGGSPADLSAFLIVRGPAFKQGVVVDSPTSLTDIAPTLLHALRPGLEAELSVKRGRVLVEALREPPASAPTFEKTEKVSKTAPKVAIYSPTRPVNAPESLLVESGKFTSSARGYLLEQAGVTYSYWVEAGATRSPMTCADAGDCPEGVACGLNATCAINPTCTDGVKNGLESDVDCGFSGKCVLCSLGQACVEGRDCHSQVCSPNKVCN